MRRYWGAIIPPKDHHREFRVVKGLLDVEKKGMQGNKQEINILGKIFDMGHKSFCSKTQPEQATNFNPQGLESITLEKLCSSAS